MSVSSIDKCLAGSFHEVTTATAVNMHLDTSGKHMSATGVYMLGAFNEKAVFFYFYYAAVFHYD